MKLEDIIIKSMEKQMGTAKLEKRTIPSLLKGIFGRYLQFLAMYVPMTPLFRVRLQRARGVKIGKNVFLGSDVFIDPAFPELIEIMDYASLAGRNILMAHSDPTFPIRNEKLIEVNISPIKIEKGAWITVGVIILPGVTVGENAVVAAGAVVTKDIPPYTLVGGIPAKIIKKFIKPEESN
jgi:acetyltransferase-like isoleucine patch superfamily enzyme